MTTSPSIEALRRANPRATDGFARAVEAAGHVRDEVIATSPGDGARARVRRRRLPVALAAGLAALLAAVAALTLAPGHGPAVQDAGAAVRKAATVTAVSAERSGTAAVRLTHGGEPWAGATVRWNGDDLVVKQDAPARPGKVNSRLLLVDGMMYGVDEVDGGWVEMGPPSSIDPGSGTTPAEYLQAARDDVGGVTLRRVADAMTGLTTRRLEDGSTVYAGRVPAKVIAPETGLKDGERVRALPFGYVANGEAANGSAALDTEVMVGADGIVRSIVARWGSGADSWTYAVSYRDLGSTAALRAPKNAEPLDRRP